jgi:hypothetical protein
MLVETALLLAIYSVWVVTLVNAMISSEEISLTIATLPFIVTFPMAFLLSVVLELYIPNILQVNIMLTVVVGILIFVRWVMAIVGE